MQTQKATTLEKYDPFEGEIIVADNLSYEEFLRLADGRHAEWYEGKVILVMANSILHQRIVALLSFIFRIYFDRQPIGQHILASFSMRTEEDLPRREPDIVIVLNEHADRIQDNFLDGPADIAIEIVSPESVERDYGKKLLEYEQGGVREYWLIDPLRHIADVYVLDEEGHYQRAALDEQGRFVSSLLPDFALLPSLLWQEPEPGAFELIRLVEEMIESK